MLRREANLAKTAIWLVLGALLAGPVLAGPSTREPASLTNDEPARVVGRRLDELPAAARGALADFVRSVETGDRAAALELLLPGARLSAAPLLNQVLATPTEPRSEVRLLVSGFRETDEGVDLRAILRGRLRPTRPDAAPGLGSRALPLAIRWLSAEKALVVQAGESAPVARAEIEWKLHEDAERVTVVSRLWVEPAVGEAGVLSLSVPPGTTSIGVREPGATTEWLRLDDEEDGGRLLVHASGPIHAGPVLLRVEHEGRIPEEVRAGGDTLYFPHAGAMVPWADGRFHRWEITLDLPAELKGVSIGRAVELEAPDGRRRLRYSTERPIDYPGLAVGRFRVDKRGPLELWRVAQVGGAPETLLGELAELVEFHETRVAPLPYGAFRLVELDMGFAGAVSYASVIFMKTSVMAKARERFAILSHEVAHQWWGNAVQGDQHTRWISEGMANALMDLFIAHAEGADEKQDQLDRHREQTLAALGPGAMPLAHVRGRPADFYERGALFVHALHEWVGDEVFWRILQAWYAEHAKPAVGTPALRATAERVAGRSLAEIFDPWLGTTALPVLGFDWSAEGSVASMAITQEKPHFALNVPVEAMLPGGRSEWMQVAVTGARTESSWELPEVPLALRLDPEALTPRVLDAERANYLLLEAGACLARGENERGLALLERVEADGGTLPPAAQSWRAAALAVEGKIDESDALIQEEFATLAVGKGQVALLARVDALLSSGKPKLALQLSDDLAGQVADGAAIPLRRAHALRMLGREDEAVVAWKAALAERPAGAAARVALGIEAASEPEETETFLGLEDPRLAGNNPNAVSLVAASKDRWGLVLPGSRMLLLGQGDAVEAVPDYSPAGLLDAVVAEADAAAPLVVALEAGRRRGRLTVIELDERGRGRVSARHERIPAKARAILSDGTRVFVAWKAREEGLDWYRFTPDLRGESSAGPDDRDGLVTLKVKDDARFESAGHTPEARRVIALAGGSLAWLDRQGVLRSETGVLWEQLEGDAWTVLHLRRAGSGAGLLLSGDRSESPFPEDALPETRLLVVDAESFVERTLPDDALQAVLGPDGSVLVLRGFAGCSGLDLSVSRLAPAGP
jgi:hypothetical protein